MNEWVSPYSTVVVKNENPVTGRDVEESKSRTVEKKKVIAMEWDYIID